MYLVADFKTSKGSWFFSWFFGDGVTGPHFYLEINWERRRCVIDTAIGRRPRLSTTRKGLPKILPTFTSHLDLYPFISDAKTPNQRLPKILPKVEIPHNSSITRNAADSSQTGHPFPTISSRIASTTQPERGQRLHNDQVLQRN